MSDKYIELYKEATKNGQLDAEQVIALGQPPAPGLRIFKVFRYLVQRIEAVQQPSEEAINKAVDDRIQIIRGELQRQFERREARFGRTAAVPAIAPRDREPQA